MAERTGTVICKLCDEPLKIVKTKEGKIILACECLAKEYQMHDVGRLLAAGTFDAVEHKDDEDDFDDDEDEDEDDYDRDEDDFDDDEDRDNDKRKEQKGPSGR
jgi:hypothetical protein